eukprot:2953361-Karenia_brevis.AAC.1
MSCAAVLLHAGTCGVLDWVDIIAIGSGAPLRNMILLSLARDKGLVWWWALGAWGLLMCGWHADDFELGAGRFLPMCELVSFGVGCALGSSNPWRMCAFGI